MKTLIPFLLLLITLMSCQNTANKEVLGEWEVIEITLNKSRGKHLMNAIVDFKDDFSAILTTPEGVKINTEWFGDDVFTIERKEHAQANRYLPISGSINDSIFKCNAIINTGGVMFNMKRINK